MNVLALFSRYKNLLKYVFRRYYCWTANIHNCHPFIGKMKVLLGVHLYLTQYVWLGKVNSSPVTGVGLRESKWWYCTPNLLDNNWFRNPGFNQSAYDIPLLIHLSWSNQVKGKTFYHKVIEKFSPSLSHWWWRKQALSTIYKQLLTN